MVFLALKEFQDLCLNKIVLVATDNTTVVAYIDKEGGMRLGSLCALLWRILTAYSQSLTHSWLAVCGSGKAIQARPDHPKRVVPPSGGLQVNMQKVASTPNRSIYYKIQQRTDLVCVTSSRPPDLSS